jgi:hypothetical protein
MNAAPIDFWDSIGHSGRSEESIAASAVGAHEGSLAALRMKNMLAMAPSSSR